MNTEKITFDKLSTNCFFIHKNGKMYRKTETYYKTSCESNVRTYTNGSMLVTPVYNNPVKFNRSRNKRPIFAIHYINENGKLHRTDGPAITYEDGTTKWILNGNRHRTDGPACEWANGTKEWYVNGKHHRTDGPAIENSDGTKEWWVNGVKHYAEFEYWIAVQKYVDNTQTV